MPCEDQPQINLPFEWDEKALAGRLCALSGCAVSIKVTSNSVSVLSLRRTEGEVRLRLHRIFLAAGPEVISDIARFIKRRKKTERFPVLSRYIRENSKEIERAGLQSARGRRSMPPLKADGRFHDLAAVFDSTNTQYFGGALDCGIGWGRMRRGCAVRKRTLGSYWPQGNGGRGLIRINPVLDRKAVPAGYIRFVVYHEMLHAHLGIALKNGRRSMHSREFRRREAFLRVRGSSGLGETQKFLNNGGASRADLP